MTGPEHYREAENLLDDAADTVNREPILAAAQVHATLALAAATALYDGDFAEGQDREYRAWRGVAGSVEDTMP